MVKVGVMWNHRVCPTEDLSRWSFRSKLAFTLLNTSPSNDCVLDLILFQANCSSASVIHAESVSNLVFHTYR